MYFRWRNKIKTPGEELREVKIGNLHKKPLRAIIIKMIEFSKKIYAQNEKSEVFKKNS